MKIYQFKKEEAFTLNEILIVLSITVIIVFISFSAFKAYKPSLKLSGTVRDLVSDLRYSEQLALTEQVSHGIRFFSSEKKYHIIKYSSPEEILVEKYFPPEVDFYLISGFSGDQVIFNLYGAVVEPGEITLINIDNATTVIEVRASGFVKVIE